MNNDHIDIPTSIMTDIPAAFSLLTRLPIPVDHEVSGARAAIATWAYPLVGAVLGLIAGIIGSLLYWFGAPGSLAAIAALIALVIMTGGMHEDGLSDCADGFGGAMDKEKRLEIMKDSRIGAFGAVALILFILGRYSSMEVLIYTSFIPALIAVGAASRLPMVFAMYVMPNARGNGLSATVGKPPEASMAIALALTLLICFVCIGWAGIFVFGWAMIAAGIMACLAHRAIDGQTGDVLGAMQQWAEFAALGAAVAALT
ncbi:MAG: adenosylcobinamide-GDP ribazoletransferase [Proteobacteria bacterium]|nr:adenosylcobinamide-GDP ribazoletransferase [Pseudomonadota bacterium]